MYQVGVIGLGRIAATYETPESENPYCHVGGVRECAATELAAVADLDPEARETFRSTWGGVFPDTSYYESAETMLAEEGIDVVAVCVRGPYHYDVLQEVLAAEPAAIFLEKPPTCSLAEMDEVRATAEERGIPITVSYSRHWAPEVLRMHELVEEGVIGDVERVVSYGGGRVLSFTSHATELMHQFAGSTPVAVTADGTVPDDDDLPDGFEPEPELNGMLVEYGDDVTGFQVGGHGEHGVFYADVYGTEGSLRVGNDPEPAIRNADGEALDLDQFDFPAHRSVFAVAYEQIADYLDGGDLPDCTDEYFETVNEVAFGAIESIYTGERIELPNETRDRRVFANW